MATNRKLKGVDRRSANIEAEKGETVITSLFGPNVPEHYIIEGEKHSKGGTPLDLPKDSFIFSNSKELRITDPDILKMYDMKPNRKGYTPAEIAKKYDINKYKEILLNPDADTYEKETAILMLNNMFDKLSSLALYQESMKGFPQGIPSIALNFMEKNGIRPEDLVSNQKRSTMQNNAVLEKAEDGYITLTGNPLADEAYNLLMKNRQKTYETLNQFSTENITKGPLSNDRGNFNITSGQTDETKTEDNTQKKKLKGAYTFNIPMNGVAAIAGVISSALNKLNTLRRESQLADMFSGEEKATYTTADYGDYVESGTQYGTFRPNEQVYAVNPQNLVSKNPLPKYDKGGFTEDEKKKILQHLKISDKDADKIVFLDEKPTDANSIDKDKIYIYKDKDSNKYSIYTYSEKVSLPELSKEQKERIDKTNDEKTKLLLTNAYKLISVYDSTIKTLDEKIKNTTDEEERKKLETLKKLQYTNRAALQYIANNPEKYKDDDNIFNDIVSNKSEKLDNRLLNKIKTLEGVNPDYVLSNDEIKEAQKLYNDQDFLKKHNFTRMPFGYDEYGQPKHISPVDNLYGNTTFGYLLYDNSMIKKDFDVKDLDIKETPGLDKSKVKGKPEEKKSRTPFFTQDLVNLANAIYEKAKIKKVFTVSRDP